MPFPLQYTAQRGCQMRQMVQDREHYGSESEVRHYVLSLGGAAPLMLLRQGGGNTVAQEWLREVCAAGITELVVKKEYLR
jgi:hypothetical protein